MHTQAAGRFVTELHKSSSKYLGWLITRLQQLGVNFHRNVVDCWSGSKLLPLRVLLLFLILILLLLLILLLHILPSFSSFSPFSFSSSFFSSFSSSPSSC